MLISGHESRGVSWPALAHTVPTAESEPAPRPPGTWRPTPSGTRRCYT